MWAYVAVAWDSYIDSASLWLLVSYGSNIDRKETILISFISEPRKISCWKKICEIVWTLVPATRRLPYHESVEMHHIEVSEILRSSLESWHLAVTCTGCIS